MENSDPVAQRLVDFFTDEVATFFTSQTDGVDTRMKTRQRNYVKRVLAANHDVYVQINTSDGAPLVITKSKYNETTLETPTSHLSQRDAQLISTILTALEKWNGRD